MKKIIICLLLLLLVGCNGKVQTNSSFVYLIDPSKEPEYNEDLIKQSEGIDNLTIIESNDSEEYLKNIKQLNGSEVELIISTDSLVELAKDNGLSFKNQKIAALSDNFVKKYLNENIQQVTYKTNYAGFLIGVASSYYAVSNGARHVGYIISEESEKNSKLLAGFEDGVWQEYPECTIVVGNITNGEDVSEVIGKMVEQGVSLIFTTSHNGNLSCIDEISKRRSEGENIFAVTYDCFQRDAGNYLSQTLDKNGEVIEEEWKNSIYFRAFDDNKKAIEEIIRHYQIDKLEKPVTSDQNTAFITEVLNDSENIDLEILEDKISHYRLVLNNGDIIVRTTPSNANIESRVKIVE